MQQNARQGMNEQMFLALCSRPSAAIAEQTRLLVHEAERHKFRESSSALLNTTQEQEMPNPIRSFLDVAIHHRRSGWDAKLMGSRDDFDPPRNWQLVWAQLASNAVIKNFRRSTWNAAQAFVLHHLQIVAKRHASLINAV